MGFRILTDYARRPHLEFFRANPYPFYSVTFDLEATRLRARAREAEGSTYAALCWAFHRALLQVEAFRLRLEGDGVVLYDTLHMGMNRAGARGHLLLRHPGVAGGRRRIPARGGARPGFPHVPAADVNAGQPNIAFSRLAETSGTVLVAVGLAVNHRYVDGADLGALYESAAESFRTAF